MSTSPPMSASSDTHVIYASVIPYDKVFWVPPESKLQFCEYSSHAEAVRNGGAYLKMRIFSNQALNMVFDHPAFNVCQAIEPFEMVAESIDVLPASHGVGTNAGMRGTQLRTNVLR